MNWIGQNQQLFGWSETTWLWLDQAGIIVGDIMLLLGIFGSIWAWLRRDSIRQWLRLNRFPINSETVDENDHWDAIIFTVSQHHAPQWVMNSKRPAAVGLVATGQSLSIANRLADHARKTGITPLGPRLLEDADDPKEARAETLRLVRRLRGMGHERIAVDVTGGKTPMSIGAFLAAQEAGCDTLYVASRYDAKLKKPDMRSARIRCITLA